jgi:hypothetical protein
VLAQAVQQRRPGAAAAPRVLPGAGAIGLLHDLYAAALVAACRGRGHGEQADRHRSQQKIRPSMPYGHGDNHSTHI